MFHRILKIMEKFYDKLPAVNSKYDSESAKVCKKRYAKKAYFSFDIFY